MMSKLKKLNENWMTNKEIIRDQKELLNDLFYTKAFAKNRRLGKTC